MKLLRAILLFLLMIFPMVVFHEFGHYLVGKSLGLNPETFSFGFGTELFSFQAFNTTWKISAIPLGGYVEFPESAKLQSWKWILTCMVGPLFNFLYTYIILVFVNYNYYMNLMTFEGTHRDKKGIYFIFTPRGLFRGTIRVLFQIKENGKTFYRVVDSESLLERPVNLRSLENIWKNIFTLSLPRRDRYFKASGLKNLRIGAFKRKGLLGPLGMIEYGSWAFSHSPALFLVACASFSFSLGVMNLLPLSILDGGQVLMAFLDIRPEQEMSLSSSIYVVLTSMMVLGLILAAFWSDIKSLFKRNTFKKKR